MSVTRREFLRIGAAGGASLCLPFGGLLGLPGMALAGEDRPQFYFHLALPGGLDPSYLFDARLLAMTAAGKIQNYIGEDPSVWEGKNGQGCLATKLTAPLLPYRDYFSVLNGVVMEPAFDGHGQNMNYLFTGSPFGGESFVPHLNLKEMPDQVPRPVDAVSSGFLFLEQTNGGGIVPLQADATEKLIARIRKAPPLQLERPLIAHLHQRLLKAAGGAGVFSLGSGEMLKGFEWDPKLSELLKNMQTSVPTGSTAEESFISLALQCFSSGVSRSAVLSVNATVDTHDETSAKAQPQNIATQIVRPIVSLLKLLRETPYDSSRSFYDVTTFMVSSEFGRTMRQLSATIDHTGTDHNPLSNSILVGGRGIRGGLVLGESDFAKSDEVLSGAHKIQDPQEIKVMGRPFDFEKSVPSGKLPAEYDPADYLNAASVVNSLYSTFRAPASFNRKLKRNGPDAPLLKALLT